MALDSGLRSSMFKDSGGVEAKDTTGLLKDWGHLLTPTAELFARPALVSTDRQFSTDADGPIGELVAGETLEIDAVVYTVSDWNREGDGGIVHYLLSKNL